MVGLGLLIPIVLLAGLFFWFRASRGEAPPETSPHGRISLLTEAVGYVGAVLMLAGAGAAIAQGWGDLAEGARLASLVGSALFFLGIGFFARRSSEPALVRLSSVVWLLSTIAVAGALAELSSILEASDETAFLVVAAGMVAWAGALYAAQRLVLQHVALYAGVLMTGLASVQRIDPGAEPWVGAVVAWAIGLGWLALGRRRLVTPWWVAIPLGMLTTLIAPSAIAESSFAAMFLVGIGTAAGVMAFSVHGRFAPGLALGALGLFAYVTGAVVHYFGDSLGVPVALAITGGVILVIAGLSSKLVRFTKTPQPRAS
jgi:hypothetical protein